MVNDARGPERRRAMMATSPLRLDAELNQRLR